MKAKTKIAGIIMLLAGTATVFATTHKPLSVDSRLSIHGAAGFIEPGDAGIGLEMEFVGLQPGSLYVARLENATCSEIPKKVPGLSNGISVAMFVESNIYGAYSSVLRELPKEAKAAQSIALYKENGDSREREVVTVYCQNIG